MNKFLPNWKAAKNILVSGKNKQQLSSEVTVCVNSRKSWKIKTVLLKTRAVVAVSYWSCLSQFSGMPAMPAPVYVMECVGLGGQLLIKMTTGESLYLKCDIIMTVKLAFWRLNTTLTPTISHSPCPPPRISIILRHLPACWSYFSVFSWHRLLPSVSRSPSKTWCVDYDCTEPG